MRDRLRLHRGVHHHTLQILGLERARLVRHRQALLDQRHQLLLTQALTPARYRGAVERQLVAEAQLAAEVLVIRILDPARAQHLVGQVVHVLQDEEAGHQPRRQAGLAGSRLAHRAEATIEKAPIDLTRQAHQRMPHVDDLIERRPQQVLLAIVSRSSHLTPPRPPPVRKGIESRTAKNRNPKTQESELRCPLSCKIDYSFPPTYPLIPAAPAFFTGDGLVRVIDQQV